MLNQFVINVFFLKNELYLVFAESLNEAGIDVGDGDAEDHNNHVLGHSFSQRVSVRNDHGHISRRHIHLD